MSVVEEGAEQRQGTVAETIPLVDAQHPWLGLDSFSEETRSFFYGRDEEIAELGRRVQRKTLTVLFGQSGLGKTSILRAGLVPRLRREGFCPVYVRIDYAQETPAPAEQIKQAIFRATESAGHWSRPGASSEGETLWEFLHHREDVLRDESGRTLVPLLIFDQFEEIFTLAQDDDFGRRRAAEFVEDLADLVEGRLPARVEAMLDEDETVVERFDFDRTDYRILLALREDYLAHLEAFKGAMPSITQNRMRLARMTGEQALVAVMKPGGALVSQDVAEAIVRFVAGGAELRNAEVEPALLSLVCRELNNARVARGRREISADVLDGSNESILAEFYERALADQPAGVRTFIEDEMLTESGFRESIAEERVRRAFAAAGAAPGALAALVNQRLLRIEERLDLRRVELTHDVLCPVVRASRDRRHEREQGEAAARELAAQRDRELAARRALRKARQVAAGASILALLAVVASVFGYMNMQRAREAEGQAQQSRGQAEAARAQAEKLIVFLLDDFYLELEPVGRLDIVARLSRRAIDYYAALPPELRTPETERTRALALARFGFAERYLDHLDSARKSLDESIALLKDARARGDTSEAAAIGLALATSARGRVFDSEGQNSRGLPLAREAAQILEPLMAQPQPSVALRRAYGQVMTYMGFNQMRLSEPAEATKTLRRSQDAWRSIDGLALNDLASAAGFAEATSWLVTALNDMGRTGEARAAAGEGIRVATAVLDKQPGHLGALRSHGLLNSIVSQVDLNEFKPRQAEPFARASMQDWTELLKHDPGNSIGAANKAAATGALVWSLWSQGRSSDAIAELTAAIAPYRPEGSVPRVLVGNLAEGSSWGANWTADMGQPERSAALLDASHKWSALYRKGMPADALDARFVLEREARGEASQAESARDYPRMLAVARASVERLSRLPAPTHEGARRFTVELSTFAHVAAAYAHWYMNDDRAAEAEAREALRVRATAPAQKIEEQAVLADAQAVLAAALARQGRFTEAQAALAPALAMHRRIFATNTEDLTQQFDMARMLYVAALANPAQAAQSLGEAQRILAAFPPDMSRRHSVQLLAGWIARDKAKLAAAAVARRVRLAALAACAIACALAMAAAAGEAALRVGSKRFTESYILGEILVRTVRGAGAEATHSQGLGNTGIVLEALRGDSIDVYPEYTGTIAREVLHAEGSPDLPALNARLAPMGLAVSVPLGFQDTYAIGMRADEARRLGITKLSDLATHPQVKLGLSHEFLGRQDGWPGLAAAYGLRSMQPTALDHGLAYDALATKRIDATDVYTTDARIARDGLVVLDDDRGHFPRYDAVLLHRIDVATRHPAAWKALAGLEGRIDTATMAKLNARAEIDRVPVGDVAAEFLSGKASAGGTGLLAVIFSAESARMLAQHVGLVLASLVAAVAIGVPLGIAAARRRALAQPLLAGTGLLQTIPSLALLAFLIPLTGTIGLWPATIALFLYALLPIVRNTYAGLRGVRAGMRQAALALGLAPRDILLQVELPLAMPVILAGIQTAAVVNVGTATIAAFIGAGGFGERISQGLALNDHRLLLAGALPAALLALAFHAAFAGLERVLVPRALANATEATRPA